LNAECFTCAWMAPACRPLRVSPDLRPMCGLRPTHGTIALRRLSSFGRWFAPLALAGTARFFAAQASLVVTRRDVEPLLVSPTPCAVRLMGACTVMRQALALYVVPLCVGRSSNPRSHHEPYTERRAIRITSETRAASVRHRLRERTSAPQSAFDWFDPTLLARLIA
jgi:hypothetical protein